MTEKAEAAEPETKVQREDTSSSGSVRRSPPILGLVIVSALNIASLAFITYHFASHADEPAVERPMPSKDGGDPDTRERSPGPGVMVTTAGLRGNVDLLPAPDMILEVASGIEPAAIDEADPNPETSPDVEPQDTSNPEANTAEPANWVQLGALSRKATAERFWTELQAKHAELLEDRKPHFVGPDDGGGKLYHIRVGPMATDDAAALCKKLEARGADCFCLKADAGVSS